MFKAFPQLRRDEPLSKHCWYALGGPADFFVEVDNTDDIPKLIREARENNLPYFVLGGGSNTVFHDEGLRGLIIKVAANNFGFKDDFENDSLVIAAPGALTSQIAKESIDRGLTGIESLYGLPGTVGGAIFGNAEAHKASIGDFVESIILYDADMDSIREVSAEYFGFAYRHSALHKTGEIILKVILKLEKIDKNDEAKQKAIDALNFRKEHQPAGRNNGSFFKNPDGDSAGRLIDVADLKGTKIGGAYISEKHGNFFMNDGTAKTQDLIDLKNLAQRTIKEKFDINLRPEVRIIMPDGTCLSD
ncbi:MAG: UDP-N-acetylmuramate dehydrogenase [Candidatus Peregrinibacteria bacterium]|nr:UDP-N-acetylmuramate dehydrogenase [Candidatus Peregrinibacteria bacterium]MDZ4245173.1 UDP-N-acetylmuramate dehydrogenase [Candidatus Gracilibacteria bacterium]